MDNVWSYRGIEYGSDHYLVNSKMKILRKKKTPRENIELEL